MLRRLLPVMCRRAAVQTAAVQAQQTRSSTYFCFDKSLPIIPPCYSSELPNGIRVITEQTEAPMACVALFADAGSRYENSVNNGACHFFELLSVRGLRSLSRCDFQECLREMGAYMDIHTDREYQAFICRCSHKAVYPVINLFARMLSELDCNDCEIMCAKEDAIRKLQEIDTDYKKLCFDYLHQTAYQGTAMARAPEGPYFNYKQFDAPFLSAFVAQQYQPFRLLFSVSSIHSHHDVFCKVQKELGCMTATTNDVVIEESRYTGSMLRFRDDSVPFCHIALAVEACGYNSRDYMGYHVMKHIIGRWDESQQQKFATWPMLAHACAISKLCYRYESFYLPYKDTGLWGVYFVVKKEDDYEDAILMIQDQWMKMCNNLSVQDVTRAVKSLKLELAKSVESCVSTCIDMGLQMLFTGRRLNLIEQFDRVDAFAGPGKADVLAYRSIYDKCCVVSAVGPTEAVPDYNRTRAGMYWLRF